MAFTEKPPMLAGTTQQQVNALRDYLFRMASSLETAAGAPATTGSSTLVVKKDGGRVYKTNESEAIEAVRRNAQELRSLIIKTANGLGADISAGDAAVIAYADQKTETYDSRYVAMSDYGAFVENIHNTITSDARGVIEEYGYGAAIESMQGSIDLVQNYFTAINGEIRRGIVEDPDNPGEYVTGIAISQNLQFEAECGPDDPLNPGDGHTYYYLNEGQTFGLYTSTGWQFWIDGYKKGWFTSLDGILHVKTVQVEDALQIGSDWKVTSGMSSGFNCFEIRYVGG